jgi:hypothetical protein
MSDWTGRIAFAFCLFLLSMFALVRWAQSCSDPGDPFADYSQHPDIPLEKFVQGQLGIVEPTFARSYLVVAYRYATGVPLTKDEQEGAIAVWRNRGIDETRISPDFYTNQIHPVNHFLQEAQDASEGPKDWVDARARVASPPVTGEIKQLQELDTYNSYVNCSNDAFAAAAATLSKRVELFGKDAPGVRAWVAAQDAVFANCAGDPSKPVLPAEAEAFLPEIFRYDREYQIAAANMYSNNYEQAIQGFQRIAQERVSPWHDIAPYLAARTMVRRATVEVPWPDAPKGGYVPIPPFEPDRMQAAFEFATKTLSADPHGPFALPIEELLERADFRLHPAERSARLAELLAKPSPDGRFYNWLWDYTWLLDRRGDAGGDFGQSGSPQEYSKNLSGNRNGPLTDWIMTFQMKSPAAAQHALELWRSQRESMPWLIAVLSKTDAKSPEISEVLAAADKVPPGSTAYMTVLYHRMRLLKEQGKFQEVRSAIDTYLGSKPDASSVSTDYLLDLRLDSSSSLVDAARFLPRGACSVQNREAPGNCPTSIPVHSASFLNALPLEALVELLHNQNLPDDFKAQFVRNIWLRAVLLGRYEVAQALDEQVFRAGAYQSPVANDVTEKLVKEFESASTPEGKKFAAIFLMQHQYAIGYEMGSVGSWCASPRAFSGDQTAWGNPESHSIPAAPPPFLTEAQRKQAETEQSTLDQTDSQANYYTSVVLDYAEKHADDPRVPEALSRAVKNTRMNCNNSRTGDLSQGAYNLLHKRYPETTWAKNTKYWYGAGY